MDVQKNIIALEEIQTGFKKLSTNIFLILHVDNYSDTPREDEFKNWTNEAKAIINQLNEKYSNNKLLKNELNAEINKLKSLVNVLEDELLKEGLKKNGRVIGLMTQASIFTERVNFENFISDLLTLSHQQTKSEQKAPKIKPIFKPEAIPAIFDLLKDFFNSEHQTQLKKILGTGNDASESLIFLDNGNRLADAFKQLIKADIITGCEQKELESWILGNFKYRHRGKIKDFTPRYLNDIISTNKDSCQSPLLNVTKEKATGNVLISKA